MRSVHEVEACVASAACPLTRATKQLLSVPLVQHHMYTLHTLLRGDFYKIVSATVRSASTAPAR